MRKFTRTMSVILALVLVVGIVCIYTLVGGSHRGEETTAPVTTTAATTLPPETTVPETTAEVVTVPPTTAPQIQVPELTAQYVFVADGPTGNVLYEQGGMDTRIYPASITKLFTAWVALRKLDPQTPVTAGSELSLVAPDSSRAFIYDGQTVSVEQLVQGMLMNSGNDAAYILATAAGRAISGDDRLEPAAAVSRFVDEMNLCAVALGLEGTHFVTPDGYHDENHYTTMEDLVVIAQLCMLDDTIRKYSAMDREKVVYLSGHTNTWINTNLLVDPSSPYYMSQACGLKTGHTNASGYCLLSAVRRDDGYDIIGVFGATGYMERFDDTRLLAEAFLDIPWDPPVPETTETTEAAA